MIVMMMIIQVEGEDGSNGTRSLVKSLVKIKKQAKYVWKQRHFTQCWVEVPSAQSQDQDNSQVNLLRRTSTHNLSSNAEAEAKAKDKFKAFYFKLVPFVSS